MNAVRIQRVTAATGPEDALRNTRITKRAMQLLGRQLAMGDAVTARPKLVLDVTMQPGMSEEQMAQRIARELAMKLL